MCLQKSSIALIYKVIASQRLEIYLLRGQIHIYMHVENMLHALTYIWMNLIL